MIIIIIILYMKNESKIENENCINTNNNIVENECNNKWIFTWNKSLKDNNQLNFSRKMNISCVDSKGDSESEIFDIIDINLNLIDVIGVEIDNRTSFYQDLLNNSNCFMTSYLPLNKEKYRFKCDFLIIESSENKEIVIKKNKNSYFELNNSDIYTKLIEYLKEKGVNILNDLWSKMQEEMKLDFQNINPDTIKNFKNLFFNG